MSELRFLSKIEQLAAYLRAQLAAGRWEGAMPGRKELAAELRLNERTVEEALRLLEREGVLLPQGAGRRRLIALGEKPVRTSLKIRILLLERIDQGLPYHIDLLHTLRDAGHNASFAEKSLCDLGMNVKRVAAYVKAESADAWIVCAGSREVLEWFAGQATPAFAKFGKSTGLPLAGIRVDKIPAFKAAVRKLHGYGHRRIVMMIRQVPPSRHLGPAERAFLEELEALGMVTGSFNMPAWGNDIAGFHRGKQSGKIRNPVSVLLMPNYPVEWGFAGSGMA